MQGHTLNRADASESTITKQRQAWLGQCGRRGAGGALFWAIAGSRTSRQPVGRNGIQILDLQKDPRCLLAKASNPGWGRPIQIPPEGAHFAPGQLRRQGVCIALPPQIPTPKGQCFHLSPGGGGGVETFLSKNKQTKPDLKPEVLIFYKILLAMALQLHFQRTKAFQKRKHIEHDVWKHQNSCYSMVAH